MPKATIERPAKLKEILKSIIDEIGDNKILTGSISFDRKTTLGPIGHERMSNILEIKFNVIVDLSKKEWGDE